MNAKRVFTLFCAIFTLLSVLTLQPASATPTSTFIPGASYNTDVTWSLAGSPYVVGGNVLISNGATLTIEPGVEVSWVNPNLYLWALTGNLVANGTAQDPIRFVSDVPDAGRWRGIIIASGGSADLSHCEITNAGGNAFGALRIESANVTVTDCEISGSALQGIELVGTGLTPTLARLNIHDNVGAAVTQNSVNMAVQYEDLTMANNGENAIVSGGGSYTQQNATLSLPGTNIPYKFTASVTLSSNSSLTVEPGVTMQWDDPSHLLWVNKGNFLANGTASQPIVFTSGSQNAGSWRGILVADDGSAEFSHCEIAYAGATTYGLFIDNATVSVENCSIHDNAGSGIQVRDAQPTLTCNLFENNDDGVVNLSPATVVDASNNWWGSGSGPSHEANPGGTGDSVSDGVLFTPWKTVPTAVSLQDVGVSAEFSPITPHIAFFAVALISIGLFGGRFSKDSRF